MSIAFRVLLCGSLLLGVSQSCSSQEWRKIIPIKSFRADVEAILGTAQGAYSAVYQLKDGSLFIEYSSGPCRPDRKGGWNVPENIVVSVGFWPKHKSKATALKLDTKKFRKVTSTHLPGVVQYINDVDGITYTIQEGKVDSINFRPPKKYDYLVCSDSANKIKVRPSRQQFSCIDELKYLTRMPRNRR